MNYSKLRGKIREVFGTQDAFAAAMGKNPSTISAKLSNKTPWTCDDIMQACELLGIPLADAHLYFFCGES